MFRVEVVPKFSDSGLVECQAGWMKNSNFKDKGKKIPKAFKKKLGRVLINRLTE